MFNGLRIGDFALLNGDRLVKVRAIYHDAERLVVKDPYGPHQETVRPVAVEHHPTLDGHWFIETGDERVA